MLNVESQVLLPEGWVQICGNNAQDSGVRYHGWRLDVETEQAKITSEKSRLKILVASEKSGL